MFVLSTFIDFWVADSTVTVETGVASAFEAGDLFAVDSFFAGAGGVAVAVVVTVGTIVGFVT